MSVESEIRQLAASIPEKRPYIRGEESTKDALVRPMIRLLGYNTWNPAEVSSEFTADFGTRRHEKVDFAIFSDSRPIILIECKTISSRLGDNEISQLFRYYSATDARFAILTNGVVWKFFTDLVVSNRMDESPFFTVNLEDLDDFHLQGLLRFAKNNYDEEKIIAGAQDDMTMNLIYDVVEQELRKPGDEFIRFFVRKVYSGRLTSSVVAQFKPYVEDTLHFLLQGSGVPTQLDNPPADSPDNPPPSSVTDFSTFRYWKQTEASAGLLKLFTALHDNVVSLGEDVRVVPAKTYISFKRRRNAVDVSPRPRGKRLIAYVCLDPRTVPLEPGFTRDVTHIGHHSPNNLEVTIRNLADLERANPLLKRSYDAAG